MSDPGGALDSEPKPAAGAPAWMATMADMFSLLLTFFVLLLSFANMDVVEFRMMLGSVKDALGVKTEHPGTIAARSTTPVELSDSESTPFVQMTDLPTRPEHSMMDERMVRELERAVARLGMERMVKVRGTDRGVAIHVRGQLLFHGGSADLRPQSFVLLDEIARLSQSFPYRLTIEGHTDDEPISTPEFPSNWHLSAARAISALRYFTDVAGMDPRDLSAAGYADTRPLVPNDSEEHRMQNRRVEFVYLRSEMRRP